MTTGGSITILNTTTGDSIAMLKTTTVRSLAMQVTAALPAKTPDCDSQLNGLEAQRREGLPGQRRTRIRPLRGVLAPDTKIGQLIRQSHCRGLD